MSSIKAAQLKMGYLGATQRPACANCLHGEQWFLDRMPPYDKAGWRCKRGGFMTSARAICNEHAPKHPGSPS